jgi:hypothetical protein
LKRELLGFIIIGLITELITTWSQQFIHVISDGPPLYYPTLLSLVIARSLIWLPLFFGLIGLWLFLRRLFTKLNTGRTSQVKNGDANS